MSRGPFKKPISASTQRALGRRAVGAARTLEMLTDDLLKELKQQGIEWDHFQSAFTQESSDGTTVTLSRSLVRVMLIKMSETIRAVRQFEPR